MQVRVLQDPFARRKEQTMKLYKIFGGIAFMCYIISIASLCGAIENGLQLRWPVGILMLGCICAYIAIKESGGWYEDF